jgi:hypothetical protein
VSLSGDAVGEKRETERRGRGPDAHGGGGGEEGGALAAHAPWPRAGEEKPPGGARGWRRQGPGREGMEAEDPERM